MKKSTFLLLLYFGIITIMGVVLVLWITTPYGLGVSPDSTTYISGVKSLLAGKGFSDNGNPITHFPPLYPLFLASMGLLNNNLLHAARYQNAILFGINLLLVAILVYLSAGRSYLTTTFAVLFFLSSEPILQQHLWVLSEPLFITFFLACILLLSFYVIKPNLSLFIASSVLLGLAIVTRYIGGAFLPAAAVIVFIGGIGQKLSRRIRDTLLWLLLACAPLAILSIRNTIAAGSATDRSFAAHPISVSFYFTRFLTYTVAFIVPISLPVWARLAIVGPFAVFLTALLIILFKRHFGEIRWRSMGIVVPASCLLFSFFYFVFLYLSISFFDAGTPLDSRLLSPIFILLIVAAFSAIGTISQTLKKPIVLGCFLLFAVVFISIKTTDAIKTVATIREKGLGYTSTAWRHSETIDFIKSLGEDVRIYSNGADVIGFLTGKEIQHMPEKYNPNTNHINPLYNNEIEGMCKDIDQHGALVVYINSASYRKYLPSQAELNSTCPLPILESFADGIVYGEK